MAPHNNILRLHPTSAANSDDFKCGPVFKMLAAVLETEGPTLAKKVNGTYKFKVTDKGKEAHWIVDLKNGRYSVEFNGSGKPDATVIMSDADMWELMAGTLNPQKAFFQGKVKLQGNMALALKLKLLQDEIMKLTGSKL